MTCTVCGNEYQSGCPLERLGSCPHGSTTPVGLEELVKLLRAERLQGVLHTWPHPLCWAAADALEELRALLAERGDYYAS